MIMWRGRPARERPGPISRRVPHFSPPLREVGIFRLLENEMVVKNDTLDIKTNQLRC